MFKEKSAAALFFLLNKISLILPQSVKAALAKMVALLFYKYHNRYHTVARENLDFIYEERLTPSQKEQLIKEMFFNLAQNFGSFIENQNITAKRLLQKISFENETILLNAIESGRPVIFITAHQSNWELLALAISAKYQPLTGVGRPLKQPWLNSILQNAREQFGGKMIDKHGAMRKMVKAVKEKRLLGLLVDQSLEGVEVDFFNKKTLHTTSAAILARKFNAIVIPAFITRIGFERYRATFYTPIEVEKTDNEARDILNHTQKQAAITEQVIRQSPAEWLWIHRRWKKTYPHIYK